MSDRLTHKQRLFVEAYLGEAGGNATEAARVAGYKGTDGALRVQGRRLLTNANVRSKIDTRLDEAALSADEILGRLSEHAAGSIGEFISVDEKGGCRLDLKKAERRNKLHLIKRLKHTEYGVAIELYDAQAALVHLGRYRRLFDESASKGQAGKANADALREFLFGGDDAEASEAGQGG